MKITHSADLEKIIEDKIGIGMREQVKRLCTEYIQVQDPWSFIKGMKAAVEYADAGQDLILVKVNQGVLIFSLLEKTEEQWVAEAKAVVKKDMETPRKVLLKMVMKRMNTIRHHYEVNMKPRDATLGPIPDLGTKQALAEFKKWMDDYGSSSLHEQFHDLLEDLLLRDSADDGFVREAWDLVVTKHVMES